MPKTIWYQIRFSDLLIEADNQEEAEALAIELIRNDPNQPEIEDIDFLN